MPKFDIWNVPGYSEAVAKEQKLRDEPFTGLNEWINGVEVLPFNIRHLNLLESVRSPFIVGGRNPTPGDIAVFLWYVSPQWEPAKAELKPSFKNYWKTSANKKNPIRSVIKWAFSSRLRLAHRVYKEEKNYGIRKRQFFKSLRHNAGEDAKREIVEYLDKAFYDAPKGSGDKSQTPKLYSSWSALLIHEIAAAYGWSLEDIETAPVRKLYQLRKWIHREASPDRPLSNPSDRVIRLYCEKHLQPQRTKAN